MPDLFVILLLAAGVLTALQAFGVASRVSLGWLGVTVALLAFIISIV